MHASYSPRIEVDGGSYFPPPYSIDPLPSTLRIGLIPIGLLATLSVISTLSLICFICYRFATWRSHYRTFVGYNQYVVLVLNLLLADLQQSSAYLISFHWVHKNYILAPHPACFAQGWLLHSGDVSSAFFVLAIAVHTFYTAVYGRRIGNKTFGGLIIGIWIFSYFLTGIGVGIHGSTYYVRAGAWCWVSSEYETDRLALHYLWLFVSTLCMSILVALDLTTSKDRRIRYDLDLLRYISPPQTQNQSAIRWSQQHGCVGAERCYNTSCKPHHYAHDALSVRLYSPHAAAFREQNVEYGTSRRANQ